MSVNRVKKITDNNFLNLYNIEVTNDQTGDIYPYYVASRRKNKGRLSCISKDHNKADAVLIVPIFDNSDLVLIKQYRPAIDDYIYEFPAGLVDVGESTNAAVKRELYEEVGLSCYCIEQILKPSYTSVGMSDESCAVYIANVTGEISTEHNEGHEDIEPIVIKMNDALKFIDENMVSIKTALIMRSLYYKHKLQFAQREF
jgi:ADP-ribose pyrophosphatase